MKNNTKLLYIKLLNNFFTEKKLKNLVFMTKLLLVYYLFCWSIYLPTNRPTVTNKKVEGTNGNQQDNNTIQ